MIFSKQVVSFVVAAVTALAVSSPARVEGQVLERLPNIYPMNGLPDPYESEAWVDLPDGRTWGSTAVVSISIPMAGTSGRSTDAVPTPAPVPISIRSSRSIPKGTWSP